MTQLAAHLNTAPAVVRLRPLASPSAPIQRVIMGLGDIADSGDIPAAWIDAFIHDTGYSHAHLYQAEMVEYLDAHAPGWTDAVELHQNGNHWDVVLTGGAAPIRIVTAADGDCGAHAIHAIVNRAQLVADGVPRDHYTADAGYVAGVRAAIAAAIAANRAEVRARILHEIRDDDIVEEAGFGPTLTALLQAHIALAGGGSAKPPAPPVPSSPAVSSSPAIPVMPPISSGSASVSLSSGVVSGGGGSLLVSGGLSGSASMSASSGGASAVGGPMPASSSSSGGSARDAAHATLAREGRTSGEADRTAAIRILGDVYTQLEYCIQYNGAYSEIWHSETNETLLNEAMRFSSVLQAQTLKLCGEAGPLSEREAGIFNHLMGLFTRFQAKLYAAEHVVRMTPGNLAAPGTDVSVIKQVADRAAGHVYARDFVIPRSLFDRLRPLVQAYEPAWAKVGTDGLKGMVYADVAAVERLRQKIADIVLNDPATTMDVIAAFAEQLLRLASQSCSSRDVQHFLGWFNAHRGP